MESEMTYHTDTAVNKNCQQVLGALIKSPMTIRELSKSLDMFGYDVTVALGILNTKNLVIRCNLGKWEAV